MSSSIQPKFLALVGAAASAAALAMVSPATGIANAHGHSTPSGNAVGRPGLDNPAPGIRIVQALGDKLFNQSTAFSIALDESIFGVAYHEIFGTPNYEEPTHGSNGSYLGELNSNQLFKNLYNGAQERGFSLPDEEDLPGTLISKISGIEVAEGAGNHHASVVSNNRRNSTTRETGSRKLSSAPPPPSSDATLAARSESNRGVGRSKSGSASRTR
jgi:hypothetical protein